jgi:hypothetical protein
VILTDEQERVVTQALVLVRDGRGKVLGHIAPDLTSERLAELKRRAGSRRPFYTGAQVHARLKALQQEWDRTGGFDEALARQFLASLDTADSGHKRFKS